MSAFFFTPIVHVGLQLKIFSSFIVLSDSLEIAPAELLNQALPLAYNRVEPRSRRIALEAEALLVLELSFLEQ